MNELTPQEIFESCTMWVRTEPPALLYNFRHPCKRYVYQIVVTPNVLDDDSCEPWSYSGKVIGGHRFGSSGFPSPDDALFHACVVLASSVNEVIVASNEQDAQRSAQLALVREYAAAVREDDALIEQPVTYRYERRYKGGGSDQQWYEVSNAYVRHRLDGPYEDVDMAMQYLHENGAISTPFAFYRATSVSP